MYGDHVAVGETVHRPRSYRDAGHINWANYWTLPIRHKHIHIRGRYRRVHPLQIDEHVHVNEGGQAIIGNVRSGTAGEGHPSIRVSNEIDDDRDE
jgi:hypothetical protein